MNTHRPTFLRLVVGCLALAGFGLVGCSVLPAPPADPTRYFVLTGPSLHDDGVRNFSGALTVGLKAVEIAPYLRKPMIAVRRDTHEVIYDDYLRWAEPLEAGVARIVQARLLAAPGVGRVHHAPLSFDQQRDYDVAVSIIRCEGVTGGRTVARFAAAVEVTTGGDDPQIVLRKVFQAPDAEWDGRDYAALARALSTGVAAMCEEIVAALPDKK